MRLGRILLTTLAAVAALTAWPQGPAPPAVDHSQHTVIDCRADQPVRSLVVNLSPDRMDGFNLYLETRNFRLTPQHVDTSNVANEGHAPLYLNGEKVARL